MKNKLMIAIILVITLSLVSHVFEADADNAFIVTDYKGNAKLYRYFEDSLYYLAPLKMDKDITHIFKGNWHGMGSGFTVPFGDYDYGKNSFGGLVGKLEHKVIDEAKRRLGNLGDVVLKELVKGTEKAEEAFNDFSRDAEETINNLAKGQVLEVAKKTQDFVVKEASEQVKQVAEAAKNFSKKITKFFKSLSHLFGF